MLIVSPTSFIFSSIHTDRAIGNLGRHSVLYHLFFLVHTDRVSVSLGGNLYSTFSSSLKPRPAFSTYRSLEWLCHHVTVLLITDLFSSPSEGAWNCALLQSSVTIMTFMYPNHYNIVPQVGQSSACQTSSSRRFATRKSGHPDISTSHRFPIVAQAQSSMPIQRFEDRGSRFGLPGSSSR
jgi:hypothetical protein